MPFDGVLEDSVDLLSGAIRRDFPGRIALVSSFGAESAVLLHMVSEINPATPVLLNETGMLFPETLQYQRQLAAELMLTNVRIIRPTRADLSRVDPEGDLHQRDVDACCDLRKVVPMQRALQPYAAWITGRKRFQAGLRSNLPLIEQDEADRVKYNPLALWNPEQLQAYMDENGLPAHPLVSRGYKSIGCAPCTTPAGEHEEPRAGRWRDSDKTECGIHFADGRVVRSLISRV
jgi:phosphoadenosine phosphosulfate reductase